MSVETADEILLSVQVKAVGLELHGPDAETLFEYMLGLELVLLVDNGGLVCFAVRGRDAELCS